jgi:hypothetical protein
MLCNFFLFLFFYLACFLCLGVFGVHKLFISEILTIDSQLMLFPDPTGVLNNESRCNSPTIPISFLDSNRKLPTINRHRRPNNQWKHRPILANRGHMAKHKRPNNNFHLRLHLDLRPIIRYTLSHSRQRKRRT